MLGRAHEPIPVLLHVFRRAADLGHDLGHLLGPLLLQAADRFQRLTDWHRRRPKAAGEVKA